MAIMSKLNPMKDTRISVFFRRGGYHTLMKASVCETHLNLFPTKRSDKKSPGFFQGFQWCGAGSNRRHKDFQSFALPTELPHHYFHSFSATGGYRTIISFLFRHWRIPHHLFHSFSASGGYRTIYFIPFPPLADTAPLFSFLFRHWRIPHHLTGQQK